MKTNEKTVVVFEKLRNANAARQKEWDREGKITLEYRGNELAGEVGEACNVIKKLARERLGIRGSRATREQLADELADVMICADLVALDQEIDLEAAVARKFNKTSEANGLSIRLSESAPLSGDGSGYALPDLGPLCCTFEASPNNAAACVHCGNTADAVIHTAEQRAVVDRSIVEQALLDADLPPLACGHNECRQPRLILDLTTETEELVPCVYRAPELRRAMIDVVKSTLQRIANE